MSIFDRPRGSGCRSGNEISLQPRDQQDVIQLNVNPYHLALTVLGWSGAGGPVVVSCIMLWAFFIIYPLVYGDALRNILIYTGVEIQERPRRPRVMEIRKESG